MLAYARISQHHLTLSDREIQETHHRARKLSNVPMFSILVAVKLHQYLLRLPYDSHLVDERFPIVLSKENSEFE